MSLAAEAEIVEKRAKPRARTLIPALLTFDHYAFTPQCVIRNLTATGAAVRLESELRLPERLWLVDLGHGIAHQSRVIWRRGGLAGLAFETSRDLRKAGANDGLRQLWLDRLPRGQ